MDLVVQRAQGLYCPQGDFFIDPWRPVERAIITHAHADHARPGHAHYLAAAPAERVLKSRLGSITLQTAQYGEAVQINGVQVSLHPAGHVLGSAQVRIEAAGQVWVASGDYKLQPEATCAPFEPQRTTSPACCIATALARRSGLPQVWTQALARSSAMVPLKA
jgi:putative mRNA 3-end processing factor